MFKSTLKTSVIAAVLSIALVACNKSVPHEHTFSNEWEYDEEYHWHEATCEHKDEKKDMARHTFEIDETVAPTTDSEGYTIYKCSVCEYIKHGDYVDPIDPYNGRINSKDFKVINLSYERTNANDPRYFDDAKPLATYLKADTYKFYYLDNVDEVYYLPLSTYVDLYKGDFKDEVVNTVTEENGVATWTSTLKDSVYTLSIDKNKQTISVKGTLEESFKSIPGGRNGVNDQLSLVSTYVEGHEEKVKTFSFKEYGFDVFMADGKICLPFGLIAAETSKYVERKFLTVSLNNYLIEYVAAEQYVDFTYLNDANKEVNFIDMMTNSYKELYGVPEEDNPNYKKILAPKTLTEFNKKVVYYLFDNYYGLASVKGIKSMSNYFDNLEQSEKCFTNGDGTIRGSGYYNVLQGLNDLHTGYGYSMFLGESASSDAIIPQSFYKNRMDLKAYLGTVREQTIEKYNEENGTDLKAEKVRYSKDGKYAYFSFDLFDTYTYFGEGAVPESELFHDCYHQFVMNLNEIKAKGTVKRVFIDDSQNGGGYVALMGKLLALLSKDNKSVVYLRDQSDDAIQAHTFRVDSNNDGVYNEQDCFGNDFKFYIVTSPYSFSCGNAFPFYADKNGYAKIIGGQSGGGECCVFNYTLPTGQSITYSSPFHIGQYDATNNTFEGDEDGAYPYVAYSKNFNIYDVDTLGAFITLRDPF